MTGNGDIIFHQETVVDSTNLFYEPIPFEFLKTFETLPQVIVWVDEMPAVCHNLTCDFTYIEAVGEITSYTYDDSTGELSIVGTDLPISMDEIERISFAESECTIDETTLTETGVTCTLDVTATCGDFYPKFITTSGLVPYATDLTETTITCTITAISPDTELSPLGYNNLTITGTYFP